MKKSPPDTLLSLSRFSALLDKELRALFLQFTGYLLIAIFFAIVAYSFTTVLFFQRSATTTHAIAQAANLMLIIVPIIVMRQFSSERSSGAFELLLSTPCSELEIILAKFTSALFLLSIMVVGCFLFPLTLSLFTSVDFGLALCGLFGLWLMAASLLALGICVASFIDNPLIVAVVSLGIFIGLWTADVTSYVLPIGWESVTTALSFDLRLSRFMSGSIHLSDVTYFALIIISALVISVHNLSSR
ncbi:MAG: ABC transporter permease [Gammaproteobacteria bacterium]